MEKNKCKNCGTENSANATFCEKCGGKLNHKKKHVIKLPIFIVSICIAFIVGAIVGIGLAYTPTEETETKQVDSVNQTDVENSQESDTVSSNNKIKVGDTVTINTDNGNFEIKIDNLKKSDWYDGSDKKCFVGLLECEVKNIDFYDKYNPDGLWTDNYLVVTDQNDYLANDWNSGGDDGEYHALEQVPKGTRCKVAIPYVFTKDSKSAKVNINDQYNLTLDIE